MKPGLVYATLRRHLRDSITHRDAVLEAFRTVRYLTVQGPWQPLVVRWHRAFGHNPPFPATESSMLPPLDVESTVRGLQRDAYASGFRVAGETVDEIVSFVRADGRRRLEDPHHDCPAVNRIVHDPALAAVARGYLGAEPVLTETRINWTLPFPDEQGRVWLTADGGRFHYDLADVKALSVFVYLTDVDPDCGPHVVVRGTQRRRTPAQILRRFLDDETVARRYGDRVHTILGPRGTGWFEDITTYHKQAIGTKVRLILTAIYSLRRGPRAERFGHTRRGAATAA
jgi:hypothetical protein